MQVLTGKRPSERRPECFYHGFVLGLMVELADRYTITSNREMQLKRASSFGRYDIMLEPETAENATASNNVQDEDEKELSDTVQSALMQIEEKNYEANLIANGVPEHRIRKYGFAFCGKKVLIGSSPAAGKS